jgi:hypothetical protein
MVQAPPRTFEYDDDDVYLFKKLPREGVIKNLFFIPFHTDHPKRRKYKKMSMIITLRYPPCQTSSHRIFPRHPV